MGFQMSAEAIKEIEKSIEKIEHIINLLDLHELPCLKNAIKVELINIDNYLDDVKFNQKLD